MKKFVCSVCGYVYEGCLLYTSVDSPRSGQSETVTMHRASFPAAAAFMYSAAEDVYKRQVQGISCAVQHIDQIWHGDKASFCRYYTTEIPFLSKPCFLKTTAFVSFLVKFAVFSRICRNFFEKISGLQPF